MSQQGRPSPPDGGKPERRPRPAGRGGPRGGPSRGGKAGGPGKGSSRPGSAGNGRRLTAQQKRQLNDLIEKSHIPRTAAMRVVMGQSTLNEVLQEMLREEKIKGLMATHEFNRALATSVAMGRADLDTILLRRRKNDTLETNYDRSVLGDFLEKGIPIALALHGHERTRGRVLSLDKYGCQFLPDNEGDPIEIHKTRVKYGYDPEFYKAVRKAHSVDSKVRKMELDPILRVKDRFHFKNLTLQEAMDSGNAIRVTTLEGDVFDGGVQWFGRWEFCLRVKGGAEVTLFRHAVYKVEALERAAPAEEAPKGVAAKGNKTKKKRRH